jgi:hypothetical protein
LHPSSRSLELAREPLQLIRSRNGDHAARRQQRMIAESGGRMLEEGTACNRKPTDQGTAVVLGEARGRPPGGMIAAAAFALEQ